MKKLKNQLHSDTVISDKLHIGIELELIAKGNGAREHDEDSCYESRMESHREYIQDMSLRELLVNSLGVSLTQDQVSSLESYIDQDAIIDSEMESYSHHSECDDDDCGHYFGGVDRDDVASELTELTGNTSFKVVEDGSIHSEESGSDAEVCWNYYASKDTLKDNERIFKYLKDNDFTFNKSCGLHINLNNYLNIPKVTIETSSLDFLFNLVAPSRRGNSFCTAKGMSGSVKYSMIYNQGDRLEFRFFSPTLEVVKLNHYVVLANTIYKRLAGKNSKLPKKTEKYLLNKMIEVNGISEPIALATLALVNSIKTANAYKHKKSINQLEENVEVA